MSARRHSPIGDMVERVLATDQPPTADEIAALAHRANIADAIDTLDCTLRPNGGGGSSLTLPEILLDRYVAPQLRLQRTAVYFHAVRAERTDRHLEAVTVEAMRRLARTKPGARLALAAFGELPSWQKASRRERAAWLAGRIGAAHRGDPP